MWASSCSVAIVTLHTSTSSNCGPTEAELAWLLEYPAYTRAEFAHRNARYRCRRAHSNCSQRDSATSSGICRSKWQDRAPGRRRQAHMRRVSGRSPPASERETSDQSLPTHVRLCKNAQEHPLAQWYHKSVSLPAPGIAIEGRRTGVCCPLHTPGQAIRAVFAVADMGRLCVDDLHEDAAHGGADARARDDVRGWPQPEIRHHRERLTTQCIPVSKQQRPPTG